MKCEAASGKLVIFPTGNTLRLMEEPGSLARANMNLEYRILEIRYIRAVRPLQSLLFASRQ